jgi:hypothetical protein
VEVIYPDWDVVEVDRSSNVTDFYSQQHKIDTCWLSNVVLGLEGILKNRTRRRKDVLLHSPLSQPISLFIIILEVYRNCITKYCIKAQNLNSNIRLQIWTFVNCFV